MKGILVAAVVALTLVLAAGPRMSSGSEKGSAGESLFKLHCAVCHPDGKNIINPAKTLHSKDLKAHNITKPEDIVQIMRNPGPGMSKFDEAKLPDSDAKKIAQYILETFR